MGEGLEMMEGRGKDGDWERMGKGEGRERMRKANQTGRRRAIGEGGNGPGIL